MLIVIEGLDGAGKSTQVRKLREYLEQKTGNVEYIHFPRYNAAVYGELISRFLKGDFGDIDAVHPQLVALLFAEDRHYAAPRMKEILAAGGTVLLDRYVYSNIAYQCAKLKDEQERDRLKEWILHTEYVEFSLPEPDLNIFLDVPLGFVEQKLSGQRAGNDRSYLDGARDIHEASMAFQSKVRGMYLRLCSEDRRFARIDCADREGRMLPPDSIFSKVTARVAPLIG